MLRFMCSKYMLEKPVIFVESDHIPNAECFIIFLRLFTPFLLSSLMYVDFLNVYKCHSSLLSTSAITICHCLSPLLFAKPQI